MSSIATSTSEGMSQLIKKLEIKNKLGLHARAAALLVQTVNKFSAQVTVSKGGQTADGRSIMGVLTLAATQGSKIQVEASGEDAERAIKAIEKLVESRFNENE
jgi:phosphocarrier protein